MDKYQKKYLKYKKKYLKFKTQMYGGAEEAAAGGGVEEAAAPAPIDGASPFIEQDDYSDTLLGVNEYANPVPLSVGTTDTRTQRINLDLNGMPLIFKEVSNLPEDLQREYLHIKDKLIELSTRVDQHATALNYRNTNELQALQSRTNKIIEDMKAQIRKFTRKNQAAIKEKIDGVKQFEENTGELTKEIRAKMIQMAHLEKELTQLRQNIERENSQVALMRKELDDFVTSSEEENKQYQDNINKKIEMHKQESKAEMDKAISDRKESFSTEMNKLKASMKLEFEKDQLLKQLIESYNDNYKNLLATGLTPEIMDKFLHTQNPTEIFSLKEATYTAAVVSIVKTSPLSTVKALVQQIIALK